MSNCGNCSVELKFGNTPIRGSGQLASGETICIDCFRKLVKLDMIANSRKYSLDEVKAKLSGIRHAIQRIKGQLEKAGLAISSVFWDRKEIAELPFIILENEEISGLIQGVYNSCPGVLTTTNKRLIFVGNEFPYGLKVEDFRLDQITSVQYEAGIGIKIMINDHMVRIANVEKDAARLFCEKVMAKLGEPRRAAASVVVAQQMGIHQGSLASH
jgi:hypothetical protein